MNQSACALTTALSSVSFTSVCVYRDTAFAYVCVVRRTATHKSFHLQRGKIKEETVWVRLKFLVVSVQDQLPKIGRNLKKLNILPFKYLFAVVAHTP